ncbi:hypothetical protein OE88DRAFT_1654692 [Heliocybe sulcata]|uniref:Uncharacterized protein n=1 Tax=Heliocybe sulcata TaxID=5364 RepID=A0A5C3NDR4_9AGAM|nr:hypothetical protein OE88DRAFT_1654692 [Heliocybe sulcata]
MHEFRTPACPQMEKDLEGAVNMDRLENHTAEQTTYPMLMKHIQLPPPTSTVSSALSPPTFDACPSLLS